MTTLNSRTPAPAQFPVAGSVPVVCPTKYNCYSVDMVLPLRAVQTLKVKDSDFDNLEINQREQVKTHVNKIKADLVAWSADNDPAIALFFPEHKSVALQVSDTDKATILAGSTATTEIIIKYLPGANIIDGQHSLAALTQAAQEDPRWLEHRIKITFYLNIRRVDEMMLFLHLNSKRRPPSAHVIDASLAERLVNGEPVDSSDVRRAKYALAAHHLTKDLSRFAKLPFAKEPKRGFEFHSITTGIKLGTVAVGIDLPEIHDASAREDLVRRCWGVAFDSVKDELFEDKAFKTMGYSAMFALVMVAGLAAHVSWPELEQRTTLTRKARGAIREFLINDPRCFPARFKNMGGSKDKQLVVHDLIAFIRWVSTGSADVTPNYENAKTYGVFK